MLSPTVRDVQRQRCCKRGSGNGQRLSLDHGTTERSFNAVESLRRISTLTWTVCTAADSDRGAANLYDMLICGERWIVLMLSPIVRDVQRQRCSKRGSGDGQRLGLYDYGTTERSFHAVERWGSTLTWTVCTAADSEERQICTTCLFAESVGLWKRRRSYLNVCFLPSWSWSTLLFERGLGEEGRFDVASRSQTSMTSCQNHKQQLLRPRSGPSKVVK